jgi:uncharacterized caspase-like protein
MSRKLALIIGNSEYDDQTLARLKAPEADVAGLADLLHDPAIGGFAEVEALVNRPFSEVHPAIAGFFADKRPDDLLLLYFSGHGVLDPQGRLYLGLKNTRRTLLSGTAIASGFIKEQMDDSRSRRQVLMLDCCHSGAFARGAKGALGAQAVTDATFEGHGRVVLTATDITQYAWEGDQVIGETANSLFTHFVIEGLKTGAADGDHDGYITPDELYDYVFTRVIDSGARQKPRKIVYDQQGDLVLARSERRRAEATGLPAELQQLIASPLVSAREAAVRELADWAKNPHADTARAAREALQHLAHDDSRRVALAAQSALGIGAEAEAPKRAVPPPVVATPPSTSPIKPFNRTWLMGGALGIVVAFGVLAAWLWGIFAPDLPAAPTATQPAAVVIPATTAFESAQVALPIASPTPPIQIDPQMAARFYDYQRALTTSEFVHVGSANGDYSFEQEVISLGLDIAPDQFPYVESRRVSVDLGGNSDPAFSPEGVIAYLHFQSDRRTGAIQFVTRDGQDVGRHAGAFVPARLSGLTWSPDGRYIAFTDFDRAAVSVIEIGTGALYHVADKAGEALAWSPDGEQIAFMARDNPADPNDADAWVIYTVNIDGTGLTAQTSPYDGRGDYGPIFWTSDSQSVVYASFAVDPDGTRGVQRRWILGPGGPEPLAGDIEVIDQRLYPWFRTVNGQCDESCQ